METRPYANLLSQNEWINFILSFAFNERQEWRATDIHEVTKYLNAFPMSDDHSYTFRVMKNLASKGILNAVKTWGDRPALTYRLTDVGITHFYTGEASVQKQVAAGIKHLKLFISDLEDALTRAGYPLDDNQRRVGYVGLRHYYEWLLLQGAKNNNSPSQLLQGAVNGYGKSINKAYFYQVYRELQPAYILDQSITDQGKARLNQLEHSLFNEIQYIKPLLDKMINAKKYIKHWITIQRENKKSDQP